MFEEGCACPEEFLRKHIITTSLLGMFSEGGTENLVFLRVTWPSDSWATTAPPGLCFKVKQRIENLMFLRVFWGFNHLARVMDIFTYNLALEFPRPLLPFQGSPSQSKNYRKPCFFVFVFWASIIWEGSWMIGVICPEEFYGQKKQTNHTF